MKSISIVTLFPEAFEFLYKTGVVGSALRGERTTVPSIRFLNPSDYNEKGFKGVDAKPYGGGAGQVIRADVLENTLIHGLVENKELTKEEIKTNYKVIYLGPRGRTFCQSLAEEWKNELLFENEDTKNLVFICGRYEGIDERFLDLYVDGHISIGDFVLSGGELALLPMLDALYRLFPGVLGNDESAIEESFDGKGLEFPQYTKPQTFQQREVPKVLLSGNHANIKKWRDQERREMTKKYRPDLLPELNKKNEEK